MKKIILNTVLVLTLFSAPLFAQNITLDSSKVLALENNKHLKASRLNVEASKKVKKNAFTKYFPIVSANAAAFRSSDYLLDFETPEMNLPVYDGNPANIPGATQFAYVPSLNLQMLDYVNGASITATQPIYAGGRIRNGNKLASLGIEISESQLNLSTYQVLVSTEEYYWNLVALKEKKLTLSSYDQLLKTLQKEVGDFYEAGMVNKSDLLKIKLEINKIEANRLKLDNGIEILKMVYCQHLGIPYDQSIEVSDSIININSPESYFVEPSVALNNRQEYYMLNKAVDAEKLQKKMARGEYMPQLALGVGGLYLDIFEESNGYGIAFATLSIPISNWWGGSYKLQENEIKIKIAQNNLDEKSELLQVQIFKAYKDLTESYQQIDIANVSLEQSIEYEQEVKNNFDAGISSTSDLLEARAQTQKAKDDQIDVKSQYRIKLANYLLVVGKINTDV